MKNWFYVIAALMILLIGAYFTLPKESIESTSIEIPQVNPPKEQLNQKPYVAEGFIPEKVYEDNMHYFMSTQSFNDKEYEFFIKGNRMKVVLARPEFNTNKEKFDTIYFDTSSKSAVAYCEKRVNICDDSSKGLFILYSDYYMLTPVDWITNVKQEKVIRTEYVNDRQASLIEFIYKDESVKIWIDETYSLPAKIELSTYEKYYFTYINFNTVKDEDVLPKIS